MSKYLDSIKNLFKDPPIISNQKLETILNWKNFELEKPNTLLPMLLLYSDGYMLVHLVGTLQLTLDDSTLVGWAYLPKTIWMDN